MEEFSGESDSEAGCRKCGSMQRFTQRQKKKVYVARSRGEKCLIEVLLSGDRDIKTMMVVVWPGSTRKEM